MEHIFDGMIEIRKLGEDTRGKSYILEIEGTQFAHLATFKAGASRGGHFHKEPEKMVILDGELDYFLTDMKSKKEIRGSISEGETLNIEGGVAHLLTAKTDALVVGIIGEVESTNYQPYRKVVEEFLTQNNNLMK
jgi:quercetin dioxygenase-like cupin family protein